MIWRAWISGLAVALLAARPAAGAAAVAEAAPEMPASLAPYLTKGLVPLGDYRWFRGSFPGATAAEVQAFITAMKFNQDCAAASQAAMRAKFAAMGESFDPKDWSYSRPAACRQFAMPPINDGVTWEAFTQALERVRPYALGLVHATELVEAQVIGRGDFAQQLRTRVLGEQTLRQALIDNDRNEGETAAYSPLEHRIYMGIIARALDDRDQANTEWLSARVAADGWPSRAKVGEDAAGAAWLLAQHADANPAFQLTALRLMEKLAATGDVDPRNFAMLTDRVQLKLVGKQKYGTQWTCKQGKRVPLPLMNDAEVTNGLRAAVKLDTLDANAARMDAAYGTCPPDA
jgi:hypothetical protein